MASVWVCSNKHKAPHKVVGHLSPGAAQVALGQAVAAYIGVYSKQLGAGLKHKTISSTEAHVMHGKSVIAHFWIELLSTPTLPEGGDIYRMKGAK